MPWQFESRRRPWVRRSVSVMLAGACAACGSGNGSAPVEAADTAARYTLDWQGPALAQWTLQAQPATQAQAVVDGKALLLHASMATDGAGQTQCALAAAGVAFGDAPTQAGEDTALSLSLTVSRWDLGLGRFDTDLPQLSVVHHGERALFRLAGFKAMPGTATLNWQRGSGWRWQLDGVVQSAAPALSADASAPGIRLSIDGCSEAMQQTLRIDRVQLTVR